MYYNYEPKTLHRVFRTKYFWNLCRIILKHLPQNIILDSANKKSLFIRFQKIFRYYWKANYQFTNWRHSDSHNFVFLIKQTLISSALNCVQVVISAEGEEGPTPDVRPRLPWRIRSKLVKFASNVHNIMWPACQRESQISHKYASAW